MRTGHTSRGSLRREVTKLRRWKAEAMHVLAEWDEVAAVVPDEHMRLGYSKAAETRRYILDHLGE